MAEGEDLGGIASLEAGMSGFLRRLRTGLAPGGHAGLAVLLAALILGFSAFVPNFASIATLQAFMYQMPLLGLLSLAMLAPLITGGLNLAIIATTNQCALLMVYVMRTTIPADASGGVVLAGIGLALVAGLLLCLAIGFITGVLTAYTGVHPILVTLGTKSLIDGVSIYLTRGTVLSGAPKALVAAGNAPIFGVPVVFVVLVLTALVVGIVLKRTAFGVSCAMIGSNSEAARFSAIDTKRVLVGVYTMSSVICFVAALVMLAIFNSASADYAQSYLLVTILAAVLGGVDPFGGFGTVGGLMLALAILQVISSGFNQFGLSNYLTVALWGAILILVVTAQTLRPHVSAPLARLMRRQPS
jgi:simple sugar transport system permease protein